MQLEVDKRRSMSKAPSPIMQNLMPNQELREENDFAFKLE